MKRVEKLQYITPSNDGDKIVDGCRGFLDGGGRWIQLRMKGADDALFVDVALRVKAMCDECGATFIINDNIHIAKQVAADGVHLGKSDVATVVARELLGKDAIIGRTANTYEDIEQLSKEEIDYIGVGPYRFTTTKSNLSPIVSLAGYEVITARMEQSGITMPVVAVGGIEIEDIDAILDLGIYGVAVSGAISKSRDVIQTTKEFINHISR